MALLDMTGLTGLLIEHVAAELHRIWWCIYLLDLSMNPQTLHEKGEPYGGGRSQHSRYLRWQSCEDPAEIE